MPKKRRPHDELRPAFIEAAKTVIAQGGPGALSARGLADAVGVSVGTLYNLFGHLDGVVRAVNVDSLGILQAELTEALDQAGETVEDRLLAMAEAYFEFALAAPHRWEALFRYRTETPPIEELDAAEAALFALLRQASGFAVEDEALRALWAAVHGVAELAISRRTSAGAEDAALKNARLVVLAGLRGYRALRAEGLIGDVGAGGN